VKSRNSYREAKYYAITKAGEKALNKETLRWRRMPGLVERLLIEVFPLRFGRWLTESVLPGCPAAWLGWQRTREIGLRMAFGADRNRVVGLVMRGAFVQVAVGLALGIPIALIGAHMIANQLYLVKSYDPLSLLVAVLVLAGAAAIAGLVPARRAASIDPMEALRNQ
jgi:hypothetical protein